MSYKTILTVLTEPDPGAATLAAAAQVAAAQDAHLDVLCLGVDRTQTGYYYAGANAMVLQQTLERAQSQAAEVAAMARDVLARTDARWSVEEGVAQLPDVARHVAGRARFSDLVVLGQPYAAAEGPEAEPITEAALFEGQAPVLVLPAGAKVPDTRRIVLAWNQSAEAMRTIRAALPLLMAADTVHVAIIDPPQHGADRSDPGGPLSQFLARHGVSVEIDVLTRSMPRISDVLNRHVRDVDADMVVMGAYGHSRFREAILGGATRNMLELAEVPVFMAH